MEPSRGELAWTRGTDTQLLRWLLGYTRGLGKGTVKESHNADFFIIMTAVSAYALTVGSIRTRDTKAGADSVASDSCQKSTAGAEPQPVSNSATVKTTSLALTGRRSPKRMAKLPARQREAERQVEAKDPGLLELSHWVDDLVRDWRQTPRMVEWGNSGQFADKIEWLCTDKGLSLLEAICRESEDDVGVRDGPR